MQRRIAFKTMCVGGLSMSAALLHAGQESHTKSARQSAENFDVLVCGGGPAGFAAALASARGGAKTALIEQAGYLGGIWTAGLQCLILDCHAKGGIIRELLKALDAEKSQIKPEIYDPETMKYLLESFCEKDGVFLRYHTRTADVEKTGGKIDCVHTEGPSGAESWRAKIFIDATGNGDVAARAGASYNLGNERGQCQPATMFAIVGGLQTQDLKKAGLISDKNSRKTFLKAMKDAGVVPSYTGPSLFQIRDGFTVFMVNHEFGFKCDDANSYTKHSVAARREIYNIVNALRASGGIWKDIVLLSTAAHIGVREGRRICGLYEIRTEDVVSGRTFPDAVCKVNYWSDIHGLSPSEAAFSVGAKSKPYDIPLRALVSKDFENLMMAGRCISGGHIPHSSYRVTGNAVAMGQAAGEFAAKCALENASPKERALSLAAV